MKFEGVYWDHNMGGWFVGLCDRSCRANFFHRFVKLQGKFLHVISIKCSWQDIIFGQIYSPLTELSAFGHNKNTMCSRVF